MGVSIRRIPDAEFELILAAGYAPVIAQERAELAARPPAAVAEEQLDFNRPIVERLTSRRFRDRAFAMQVREAYDSRCAVTGLQIINGGGRAEMEAAHIVPVARDGPDSVRNGLALSRTVHWMFDRGLISIDDDYRLLRADGLLPEGVDRLFDRSGFLSVPEAETARPNPAFLQWHREHCFKG
ncbi:HNH endonuclease [Marinicauda salina]|uniref:HNH endonuclease n=2 Tax=Marinicauda salina TaxID=2135793 RepID=A0A2U2BY75_9PROT|nr:HNH endonuclease [Marinicauda salina]